MSRIIGQLSGLAQVTCMAYVSYAGTAPMWMRIAFAVFAALWLVVTVLRSSGG